MQTHTIRVELVLTPRGARLGLAAALLVLGTSPLVCESLTLSTYYPSPLGVYKQLVTTGGASGSAATHTQLARDNPLSNVGIGMGSATVNPYNKLDVNGGVAIGSSYVGDANAKAAPTNGLIVEGKVGIGTSSPGTAAVNVAGAAYVSASVHVGNDLNLVSSSGVFRMGGGTMSLSTDGLDQFNITSNNGPKIRLLDSNAPAAGSTLAGSLWSNGTTLSLSDKNDKPIVSGNASSTTLALNGSVVAQADGTTGKFGYGGANIPLYVYSSATGEPGSLSGSAADHVYTPGYFEAPNPNGGGPNCVPTASYGVVSCSPGWYATWMAGYKVNGRSYQSMLNLPNTGAIAYSPCTGGVCNNYTGSVGTGGGNGWLSTSSLLWPTYFLCCPN